MMTENTSEAGADLASTEARFSSLTQPSSVSKIKILRSKKAAGRVRWRLAASLTLLFLTTRPAMPQQTPGLQPSASAFGLGPTTAAPSPLAQPTQTPGTLLLYDLERRFAQSVAIGGGKAFAGWFADDAVTLNNGRPAILGRGNIAASATWDPKQYQLTWVPEGAQMLSANDSGFTWGHYEGRAKDQQGNPILTTGRYITLWKRTPDGQWKVALDASANQPPNPGECCTLPKP